MDSAIFEKVTTATNPRSCIEISWNNRGILSIFSHRMSETWTNFLFAVTETGTESVYKKVYQNTPIRGIIVTRVASLFVSFLVSFDVKKKKMETWVTTVRSSISGNVIRRLTKYRFIRGNGYFK